MNFSRVDLTGIVMRAAVLHGANFEGANLQEGDFEGAEVSNTSFIRADLRNSNFRLAQLHKIRLKGTLFDSRTNLDRAVITLDPPPIDWRFINDLNHVNRSYLLMIHGISDAYQEQKFNLMHQVIDQLKEVDISRGRRSIIALFKSYPTYVSDSKIRDFIFTKIYEETNCTELRVSDEQELLLLLKIVSGRCSSEQSFMLNHNGFFVQLMALCANHQNSEIRTTAEQWYDIYMNLEPLKVYRDRFIPNVAYVEASLKNITQTDSVFVFLQKKVGTHFYDGLLVSQQDIGTMLHNGAEHLWAATCFVSYDPQKNAMMVEKSPDLVKVFQQFRLFKLVFEQAQRKMQFIGLLDTLDLNRANPPNTSGQPAATDYRQIFIDTLNRNGSSVKLVSNEHQMRLTEVFEPLYTKEAYPQLNDGVRRDARTLADEHGQKVMEIFQVSDECSLVQAHLFVCLAALFYKLTAYACWVMNTSPRLLSER